MFMGDYCFSIYHTQFDADKLWPRPELITGSVAGQECAPHTHTHTNSYYQKYSIYRAILIQNNCNNIRSKYLNMRDREGEVEREGSAPTRKLSVEQLLIAVCSPAECYSIMNCSLFCIYAAHTHTHLDEWSHRYSACIMQI